MPRPPCSIFVTLSSFRYFKSSKSACLSRARLTWQACLLWQSCTLGCGVLLHGVGQSFGWLWAQIGYQIPQFGHEDKGQAQRQAVASLVAVVTAAVQDYGSERHRKMLSNCLSLDLSWAKAAVEWEQRLLRLVA